MTGELSKNDIKVIRGIAAVVAERGPEWVYPLRGEPMIQRGSRVWFIGTFHPNQITPGIEGEVVAQFPSGLFAVDFAGRTAVVYPEELSTTPPKEDA